MARTASSTSSPKLTLKHQANQANQSSLKGEGLVECKISSHKLGLIGLQFRSSLNQALVFSLIVDKCVFQEQHFWYTVDCIHRCVGMFDEFYDENVAVMNLL
jgi:hypothetical protein